MSNGIGKFLSSSLGKKLIVGLTGLLLVGFVIAHLLGNLSIYADTESGSAFTAYAQKLHDLGIVLWVMEFGLVLLFVVHIFMALKLTAENRAARPTPYVMKKNFGESSLASRNMHITGVLVLGCLIAHLVHFRFSEGFKAPATETLFGKVKDVMTDPKWAAVYVIFATVLGVHLAHGFRSAFQSIGVNHPRLNCCLKRLGIGLAIVVALGFASFPIFAMISWR